MLRNAKKIDVSQADKRAEGIQSKGVVFGQPPGL